MCTFCNETIGRVNWCSEASETQCVKRRGLRGNATTPITPPAFLAGNHIEQDHRFIKRLVKPGMGFFSFETAWRTLQGYETMNMLRKGQIRGVEKRDSMKQLVFIASLFGVAI